MKKHGKSYFGFKRLSSSDWRHKLICRVHVSTTSEMGGKALCVRLA